MVNQEIGKCGAYCGVCDWKKTPDCAGNFRNDNEERLDKQMMGMCGAYCGVCEWRESTNCTGCQKNKGEMFWGQCTVAICTVKKGYLHCGFCPKVPCPKLKEAFDNPEHGDNGERLANLKAWAKGRETYLKLTKIK
jgi:hypothetical protein